MGFFGRLPRLGYLLRLCIISIFYALGGLLVHLALPGEGTSLLGLFCAFGTSAVVVCHRAAVSRYEFIRLVVYFGYPFSSFCYAGAVFLAGNTRI